MTTDAYVFVTSPTVGGELDLTRLRGYALADAHVRFRRARGEAPLFTLGVEGGDEQRSALRAQLDRLAISFDWDRSLATDDPDVRRWSQWLFVKLAEAGRAYQRGTAWHLRSADLNAENDSRLDELEGWRESVREAQRKLLHRADGFDFDATALDGTTLSVFTGHPDSVADAEFIGMSPRLPELEGWLDDADVRRRVEELRNGDWDGTPLEQMPVVEVGMSVQVPSVAQPLPILVSPAIDARFGPAAIVGIPNADPVDKALAKRLPKAGGLAWKVESKPPKTTPAVRYLTDDMPLSEANGSGAPVPVVHCDACGAVPMGVDSLPVATETAAELPCPRCGSPAKRDTAAIHPRFSAAWLELALAVPPDGRGEAMLEHPDLARLLPTTHSVFDAGANEALLDMRTVAKALRDLGPLAFLADGEPHGPTLLHAPMSFEGVGIADAVAEYGSDAVRFAVLHAARPEKEFTGGTDALRQAAAFLDAVRSFAEPRLGGGDDARIDTSDGLRRRLASWCDTAVGRIGENLDGFELHRATRNAVELFQRIQDFEQRVVTHRGEVAGPDHDASAAALATLISLLAPLTPGLADELSAGAEWPRPQREPAAA